MEIKKHNGKEIWKPKARPELNFNDDLEIPSKIQSEIKGFTTIFGIGVNCAKQMNNFGYIMEYSMCKTFAANIVARLQRYVANTRKTAFSP